MQLQEILDQLTATPTHYNIIMIAVAITSILLFIMMLKFTNDDNEIGFNISAASLVVVFMTLVGFLIYTESSRASAPESAKITRSSGKIHIKSNSEFMKSADLDVIAEKDGYIYVEFENKTYRIEDLSKKGD